MIAYFDRVNLSVALTYGADSGGLGRGPIWVQVALGVGIHHLERAERAYCLGDCEFTHHRSSEARRG